MKTNSLSKYMLWALLLFAGACTRETAEAPSVPAAVRTVAFRAEVAEATRTVTEGRKTEFVENDRIGIFETVREEGAVLTENAAYRFSQGGWSSDAAIAFPVDGRAVDFHAYYPFSAETKGLAFDHTVALDQSAEGAYEASDLLLASCTDATGREEEIVLRFAHALALAEVTVTGVSEADPVAAVAIRARRTAAVNLADGSATLHPESAAELVTMRRLPDGSFRAVIPAQRVHAGSQIRITTRSGRTCWYRSDAAAEFAAGALSAFAVDCGE